MQHGKLGKEIVSQYPRKVIREPPREGYPARIAGRVWPRSEWDSRG